MPVSPAAINALRGPLPSPGVSPAPGPAAAAPASIGTGVAPVPAAVDEKPFTGYTPPPVYSPYMNLYRTDNDRGRINNYYSLVRPVVEQQQTNRQTQTSLQSLQSTTRTQGTQLQQLNQRTQPPMPTSTPTFMNYQNYYPGLSR
jgi:hypothetical protein